VQRLRERRSRLPGSVAEPLEPVVRALAAFAFTSLAASGSAASPQGHVAARTSVCGVGSDAVWEETRFCGGVTGDLLFGRKRNGDFGLGPFAEVTTAGFWDARYGGGLSALAPVMSDFPLVLSLGVFGHETQSVALGAQVFFGLRSYNFHGNYNLAAGAVLAAYRDLAADRATLVTLGLELDAVVLAMPFLLAAGALH
jgi:hypothetical protein